jgi:hypothetical protein
MKLRKICTALILASLVMLAYTPSAESGILKSASQIINLTGTSDSSGTLQFSSFRRVMPDGSTESFVIPHNRVLLVTKIYFVLSSSITGAAAYLAIGPSDVTKTQFYTKSATVSGGLYDSVADIESGFPLALWPGSFVTRVVNRSTNLALPGTLQCRIVGLLAPPEAVTVPIDLLLLLDN